MGKAQIHEIRGGGNTPDLLWEGDFAVTSSATKLVNDFTNGALDEGRIGEYDAILVQGTVNIASLSSTSNSGRIRFFETATGAGKYDFQVGKAPWEGKFTKVLFLGLGDGSASYQTGGNFAIRDPFKIALEYISAATFHFKVFGIKF